MLLKVQPNNAENLAAQAQALYNLKRYAEAVAPVNACMELEPKNADCKMLQANVLKRTGKTREADAAYQEALKLKEAEKQAEAEKPRKGGKRP